MNETPSAMSQAMADAIHALEAARAEKYTVDRLSSEAEELAEIASQRARDAEKQLFSVGTPEAKAAAKKLADKAGAIAQRAEEVRRLAEHIACRKAETEKAAENELSRLRSLEEQQSKKSTGAVHWFPGITIPLLFVLIVTAAVNTAKQTDFVPLWNAVTTWFEDTFVSTPYPAKSVQETTEPAPVIYTEPPADGGLIPIGAACATDRVQVTLTGVSFSDVVLFRPGNWLKSINESGVSAEEGSIFVCFTFSVKNLSDGYLSTDDFCNVSLDVNGTRYTGAEFGYEEPSSSAGPSQAADGELLSAEADAGILAPQESRNYYGFIPCSSEVNTNRDLPFSVNFCLSSSDDAAVFSYDGWESHPVTNADTAAVAEALSVLNQDLIYIRDHVGETDAEGSRAFEAELIARVRYSLSGLDEDYITDNLPATANRLPDIQTNTKSICNKLEVMGINNSAANVEKIRSLSSRTIALIQGLFDTELSAYKTSI